ncbi:MAG: 2OG-Fe(II) oxygenase [Brevundimonas sp.]|nr:MAG: 2OG-Fe(II) oxygenase [Brevundimonas sp.]
MTTQKPGLTPQQLHALAVGGDVAAQVALSQLFDREGRHDVALAWLEKAAQGGSVEAATAFGARLLVGRAAPFEPSRGAAWLAKAAETGAEAAARMAVIEGLGLKGRSDWPRAIDWLQTAARRGDAGARSQLAVLSEGKGVDLKAWLAPPAPEAPHETPRVRVYRDFVAPQVLAWIRARAEGRLDALRVYDATGGGVRTDEIRTSRGTGFGLLETDGVISLVRARMAAACGLALAHFEAPNVLNYQVGQQYRPHYDYIDPQAPALAEALARQGQRTATFLLYLNDDYEGGETAFPELDWSFKAKAGDALLFFNTDADGRPVPASLHAGLPPTSGEKWLLSQWIRDRPQPIV